MNRGFSIVDLILILTPGSLAYAAEGSLFLSPLNGTYAVKDTFELQVRVDSGGRAVNAIEAELAFDPRSLAVDHVSTEGSIIGSWPTVPGFSNTEGTLHFSGWTRERFSGSDGLVITIYFKALRVDSTPVTFTSGSVLAAEAQETNVIASMHSGLYILKPKEIPAPVSVSLPPPPANVIAVATTSVKSPPSPPIFTELPTSLMIGEQLIAKGVSVPGGVVTVTLQKDGDEPLQSNVRAASDGTFTYVADTKAEAGVYRLYAEVVDISNARSAPSDTHVFSVTSSQVAAAVLSKNDFSMTNIILALFALGCGLGVGLAFMQRRQR